jgi:nicotinamidase-related amidase
LDIFEGQKVIERTSMNSWDDEGFCAAIKATGKKNIIITGIWTEVCVSKCEEEYSKAKVENGCLI